MRILVFLIICALMFCGCAKSDSQKEVKLEQKRDLAKISGQKSISVKKKVITAKRKISTEEQIKTDRQKEGEREEKREPLKTEGRGIVKLLKLKSESQWKYEYESGKLSDTGYRTFYEEYDINGNKTSACWKYSRDIQGATDKVVYRYDDRRNMIEEYHYASDTILSQKTLKKYDSKNREIESITYNAYDTPTLKFACEYDGKNENERTVEYYWESEMRGFLKYVVSKYNSDRKITEKTGFRGNKPIYKYSYKYDGNRNLIEEFMDFCGGTLGGTSKRKYFYEYNKTGNQIQAGYIYYGYINNELKKEIIKCNKNETVEYHTTAIASPFSDIKVRIISKYNKDGNKVAENKYSLENGESIFSGKHIYRHDKKGRISEEIQYNEKDEMTSRNEKKYDGRGNVIEVTYYLEKGEIAGRNQYKYGKNGKLFEYVSYGQTNRPQYKIKYIYEYY